MPYYGPGTPWYGRRGAGNIQASEQAKARITEDIEANLSHTSSLNESPISPSDASSLQAYPNASYTGRGGAGNYSNPPDPLDRIEEAADSSFKSIRQSVSRTNTTTYGRGGLGNYAAGVREGEENEKREGRKTEEKRERLQLDIEKGVEEALAMPEKAKLPLSSPKDVKVPVST